MTAKEITLPVFHRESQASVNTEFQSRWPAAIAFILYAAVAAPNLFLLGVASSPLNFNSRLTAAVGALASLAVLFSLHRRLPRFTTAALVVLALLGGIEIGFAAQFGALVDENALSLLAETNRAEIGDLLQSFSHAALWLPFICLLVGGFAVAHPYRPESPQPLLFALAGPIILVIIWATTLTPPEDGAAMEMLANNKFPLPPSDEEKSIRSIFPAGLPFVAYDYTKQRLALKDAYDRNRTFKFGAYRKLGTTGRKIFVLVIGETSRADHWSLNGYDRETNPLLKARSNLIAFPAMFSFSTFSRLAVPALISRKPATSYEQIFQEASIVTAFKEAGFSTTWISMQAPVGFHESPISVHAYEAERTIFMNPVDYRSSGNHDTASLPVLSRIIDGDQKDHFIVIHTLGSHYRYVDRYPQSAAKFLPDRYDDHKESLYEVNDRNILINGYDNSIIETDKLLDGIISILLPQDVESWIFYSSDHGEALFDDCRMQSGHGQSSLATHNVASVFWASEAFLKNNSSLIDTMRENAQKTLSTSMGFSTMSSLGGLEVPGNKSSLDMTSSLMETPPEIANLDLSPSTTCQTR